MRGAVSGCLQGSALRHRLLHRLRRLHRNITWSMRGNFVDIPTDCPQRNERLGWAGDVQVFAHIAGYLYACAGIIDAGCATSLTTPIAIRATSPQLAPDAGQSALRSPRKVGEAGFEVDLACVCLSVWLAGCPGPAAARSRPWLRGPAGGSVRGAVPGSAGGLSVTPSSAQGGGVEGGSLLPDLRYWARRPALPCTTRTAVTVVRGRWMPSSVMLWLAAGCRGTLAACCLNGWWFVVAVVVCGAACQGRVTVQSRGGRSVRAMPSTSEAASRTSGTAVLVGGRGRGC